MKRTWLTWQALAILTAGNLTTGQEKPTSTPVYVKIGSDEIRFGNERLERRFIVEGQRVGTAALENKLAGRTWPVQSPEFVLRLADREVTGADLPFAGAAEEALDDGQRLTLHWQEGEGGLEVQAEFDLRPGEPVLRKRVRVRCPPSPGSGGQPPVNGGQEGGGAVLKDIEVERFVTPRPPVPGDSPPSTGSRGPTDLGGFGQPIFVDGSFFAGLEYPAGYNERRPDGLALVHHPGVRLGPDWWTSQTAVLGVSKEGQVEAAFREYVETFRRPPRSFTVYNSWYDVQRPQLTTEVLLDRARAFEKNLGQRVGLRLDSVVVDDGWQNHQSIWEPDSGQLPEGFGPLAKELERAGTHLGLWLPITPVRGNLDTDWGAAQGYEVGNGHFCLAGPKFRAALKAVLKRYITENHVHYFKHDFNAFQCEAEGHGHLPASPYGFEAGVNAAIEVYEFMHSLNPDLYLNPSSGMWLSPWWLRYVDTVWMPYCSDFGWDKNVPAWELRDQAMTYRDSMLWLNLQRDRVQFPVSAIMTIGLIDGQLLRLGGEKEPLDRWANDVMLNVGRGSLLKELYLTPSLLNEAQWDVLAGALKWATENAPILAHGQMILGNPAQGEVYGYTHTRDDVTLLCLRNPSMQPQLIGLKPDEWHGEANKGPWTVETLYPYRETMGAWPGEVRLPVSLSPFETKIVRIVPDPSAAGPHLLGCRYSLAARNEGKICYHLWGEPGRRFQVRLKGPGLPRSVELDGQPLSLDFDGSFTVSFPIRRTRPRVSKKSVQGQTVALELTVPAEGQHTLAILIEADPAGPSWGQGEPFETVAVNGEEVNPQITDGAGWRLCRVPLPPGQARLTWPLSRPQSNQPFAPPGYTWSARLCSEYTLARRELVVRWEGWGPQQETSLPTPRPGLARETQEVLAPQKWEPPAADRAQLRPGDLKNLLAAKLRVRVFGVQGLNDERIRLNGVDIGRLPLNSDTGQPDFWEEHVLDLTAEQLALLQATNEVVVANLSGQDCLKFGGWTLAVQRPDGQWVQSNTDGTIYCSAPGWLYFEGQAVAGTTPAVTLTLPVWAENQEGA